MGLSSFLFQSHESPISLSHSRLYPLHCNTSSHFLPPETEGHKSNLSTLDLPAILSSPGLDSIFSHSKHIFPNEDPALWEVRPKFAHRSCHSLRYSAHTITRERSRSQRSTESSLWVPISVQIQADSASVVRHSPNFLCTSNFLLSCAYPLAITTLHY